MKIKTKPTSTNPISTHITEHYLKQQQQNCLAIKSLKCKHVQCKNSLMQLQYLQEACHHYSWCWCVVQPHSPILKRPINNVTTMYKLPHSETTNTMPILCTKLTYTFKENVLQQAYQQLTGLAWITNTSVLGFSPTDVKLRPDTVVQIWPKMFFVTFFSFCTYASLTPIKHSFSHILHDFFFFYAFNCANKECLSKFVALFWIYFVKKSTFLTLDDSPKSSEK